VPLLLLLLLLLLMRRGRLRVRPLQLEVLSMLLRLLLMCLGHLALYGRVARSHEPRLRAASASSLGRGLILGVADTKMVASCCCDGTRQAAVCFFVCIQLIK
jgi:hypothetical protein